MNMIDALPFLKGWEYRVVEYEPPSPPISINPGQRMEIMEEEVDISGWFLTGGFMVDNPYVIGKVITDLWTIEVSPWHLYDYGVSIQSKLGAWCSKFDHSSREYVVQFSLAWMPFRKRRHVYVSNPTTKVAKLLSYIAGITEITDREAFLRSYRELT